MALYIFVFLGLFSPGPNIILLTASGARFGFRATLPHVLGIAVGVGIIAGLSGLGLAALFLAMPRLAFSLKIVAAAWILWMAWGLLKSAAQPEGPGDAKPFTFLQAVLFQAVNPKIWAVALAASAGYSVGRDPLSEAIRMATAFMGINFAVCLFWTFAGTMLAFILSTPRAWQAFRLVMGLLLAASAAMVFF